MFVNQDFNNDDEVEENEENKEDENQDKLEAESIFPHRKLFAKKDGG